jgi:hypothetical protein
MRLLRRQALPRQPLRQLKSLEAGIQLFIMVVMTVEMVVIVDLATAMADLVIQ